MQYRAVQKLSFRNIKGLIFDLDDTLYPEKDYVYSGFRHVANFLGTKYGLDPEEAYEELLLSFNDGLRGKNFNALLDEKGIQYDENNVGELVNFYRKHKPEIKLPESSRQMLASLRSQGFLLGLVTDGYLEAQKNKVEGLGLHDLLDAIVYTDVWGQEFWKPHKKGFVEILRILGIDGEECCHIGDNPAKDFKGAKECGMLCIQILEWADRDYADLPKEYHPDIRCESMGSLIDMLTG